MGESGSIAARRAGVDGRRLALVHPACAIGACGFLPPVCLCGDRLGAIGGHLLGVRQFDCADDGDPPLSCVQTTWCCLFEGVLAFALGVLAASVWDLPAGAVIVWAMVAVGLVVYGLGPPKAKA